MAVYIKNTTAGASLAALEAVLKSMQIVDYKDDIPLLVTRNAIADLKQAIDDRSHEEMHA